MWVDDKIWGYAHSNKEATFFLDKIVTAIIEDIKDEHPTLDNVFKDERDDTTYVYSRKKGWLINTTSRQYTVYIQKVCKLNLPEETAELEPELLVPIVSDPNIPPPPPPPPRR